MATLGQAHRFPTVIPLIAANAAPIVGVLFFGWDLLSIMFLYWMETAVALFVSHGVSFLVNFLGNREYERTTVVAEQDAPWNRVVLMHMTIIFGGWVVMVAHAPVGGLVVLGLLKIVADLHGHLRQRRGPATAPAPAGAPARAGTP